jgi:hypothetical protein
MNNSITCLINAKVEWAWRNSMDSMEEPEETLWILEKTTKYNFQLLATQESCRLLSTLLCIDTDSDDIHQVVTTWFTLELNKNI